MRQWIRNIVRIYQWLPILWQDRDWDYACILTLLKYKLKRMEGVVGSEKSPACHWEHRKVELAQAQLFISKIEDDPDDEWGLHYDQWHIGLDFNEDCKNPKEHAEALKDSAKRDKRNWLSLWSHLYWNMRNWWD